MQRDGVADAVQGFAAAIGFDIDRAAGRNERCHVGDRVVNAPAAAVAFDVHRLVEIHRTGRIDGDERNVGAIEVGQLHVGRGVERCGFDFGRKRIRQVHLLADVDQPLLQDRIGRCADPQAAGYGHVQAFFSFGESNSDEQPSMARGAGPAILGRAFEAARDAPRHHANAASHPHQKAVAMIAYNANSDTPPPQSDSPSKVMNAVTSTAIATLTTSIGGNTSVSGVKPNTRDRITSTGASTSAICSGELMTTENAYSERFLAASWMPTTFSTALPAIATITGPANASEIFKACIAGSSACTNHSDTNAAATADAASRASASGNGQRGGSCCSAASPAGLLFSEAGRVIANNTSRITATTSDIASSCGAAGVCT